MAKTWILLFLLGSVGINLTLADELSSAIFIFGDSTLDVGTNNNLNESAARADMPFYGIDFPYSKPNGRFSNGYNTADFLAKLLVNYIGSPPPYLTLIKSMSTFKRNILRGVNFASGGSGILKDTGNKAYREIIPLGMQIQQFATVCGNITEVLGPAKADALISNSFYIISTGSNDFFDYQRFNIGRSGDLFISNLQDTYTNHLNDLYNLGARKFGIVSVPPIGCTPFGRVLNRSGGCFDDLNELAQGFYISAMMLMHNFSQQFQGVQYSLANAYAMTMSIIDNPLTFRFNDVKTACCGTGKFNGETQCNQTASLCSNRKKYLFWDLYHPTQAAAKLAALTLYGGGPEFMMPVNFSRLILATV